MNILIFNIGASMKIQLSELADQSALRQAMKDQNREVPARTDGRTQAHRENWVICEFLSLVSSAELEYPLSLVPRERPDFELLMGSRHVGIEIVEASSKKLSEFSAYHERSGSGTPIDLGHFRYGSPRLSKTQAEALLRLDKMTSAGWGLREAEQDWAFFVRDAIKRKIDAFGSAGFSQLADNWLIVYSNVPVVVTNRQAAIDILQGEINDIWEKSPRFDQFFLLTFGHLIKIVNGITVIWQPT